MSDCISIPKRSIWSVLGLVLLGVFTYFQAVEYLIPGYREIFSWTKDTVHVNIISPTRVLVITYCLLGVGICLTVSIFKKLKGYEEEGLIWGLVWGLIGGLVWGLIWGLVAGVILGLFDGPGVGLIMGLIGGLIVGFIVGLSKGLTVEFK